MLESEYQQKKKKKIETIFPECIVLKNDPNYLQGFPDLTILFRNKWAVLEVKKDISEMSKTTSSIRNQKIYIRQLDKMSFARFIYPENKEEVMNELHKTFRTRRMPRISKCK